MTPIFDAHLDLAWSAIQWNRDLTLPLAEMRRAESHMADHRARGRATLTLPELRRASIHVCLATILARAKAEVCPKEGFSRRDLDYRNQTLAHAMGMGQLAYYQELERQGHLRFLRTAQELRSHWRTALEDSVAPLGIILAMEGADPITSPAQVDRWWRAGLRCVGLAHYAQGPYAMGTGFEGSVTPAGRELLREFARVGMIVDLTHTAEPGFFEVLETYAGPVHASHNMCRALVPADRQFSDDQIRRLLARDAVIGMAFDAWMLSPGWVIGKTSPEIVSLEAVADHIDHICQLAGNANHVGIGSDLDGGYGTEQTPRDLDTIADLQKVAPILAKRGYSSADVDKIFHGNWLRFFARSLPPSN